MFTTNSQKSLRWILGVLIWVSGMIVIFGYAAFAHAQIALYMVGIMDRAVYQGEVMRVVWIAPAGRTSSGDWVGLYRVGDNDRRPVRTQAIDPNAEFGYLQFVMATPGDYEVRMFAGSGSAQKVSTASGIVRVRPDEGPASFADRYRLTSASSAVGVGEALTLNWHVPWNEARSRHWVGAYERGSDDRTPVAWTYLSPSGTIAGTNALTIRVPGTYELRMFAGSGYERVYTASERITVRVADPALPGKYRVQFEQNELSVGDPVRVQWKAPRTSGERDWIGLYLVGTGDRQYRAWEYVGAGASGTVTFTTLRAGEYEARYFLNNEYAKVGETSERLIVR